MCEVIAFILGMFTLDWLRQTKSPVDELSPLAQLYGFHPTQPVRCTLCGHEGVAQDWHATQGICPGCGHDNLSYLR